MSCKHKLVALMAVEVHPAGFAHDVCHLRLPKVDAAPYSSMVRHLGACSDIRLITATTITIHLNSSSS